MSQKSKNTKIENICIKAVSQIDFGIGIGIEIEFGIEIEIELGIEIQFRIDIEFRIEIKFIIQLVDEYTTTNTQTG